MKSKRKRKTATPILITAMEASIVSVPTLPDEMIIEILTRLPVKPLLKFRCVSKSWLSLISSKQFIKTHLKNSTNCTDFASRRIILRFRNNLKQCLVHPLLYEPITDAFDADFPVNLQRNPFKLVGSCDGLICLAHSKKLILWNPSTRIYKKLPDFELKINQAGYFVYGFGFDKSSNDYKVAGFFKSCLDLSEVIFQVYSLKSDQWKRVKNPVVPPRTTDPFTFVNGKLYWIAEIYEHGLGFLWEIGSLDLETEEYERLQTPNYVESAHRSSLGASDGCLHVLCSHKTSVGVWIITDDCRIGKGTWSKVATIPYIDCSFKYIGKRLFYVLKNGSVLLNCGFTFMIFDPKDGSFKYHEINNLDTVWGAVHFLESLVSPL